MPYEATFQMVSPKLHENAFIHTGIELSFEFSHLILSKGTHCKHSVSALNDTLKSAIFLLHSNACDFTFNHMLLSCSFEYETLCLNDTIRSWQNVSIASVIWCSHFIRFLMWLISNETIKWIYSEDQYFEINWL